MVSAIWVGGRKPYLECSVEGVRAEFIEETTTGHVLQHEEHSPLLINAHAVESGDVGM